MNSPTENAREQALAHHDTFCRHLLGGTMRRIAAWKGLGPNMREDLLDDVRQELAIDCLQNAERINRLTDAERHARWMRRTARAVYHLSRRTPGLEALAGGEPAGKPSTPAPAARLPTMVTLRNGRANLMATVRESGTPRRQLRRRLDDAALTLGWDRERALFWQARTSEALTGLAADLLVTHCRLHTVAPTIRWPDPERRRRRLRRIARRLPIHPSTLSSRRVLTPWARNRRSEASARRMLEQATELAPSSSSSWLWLFEACIAERDAHAAARAIRQLRACRPVPRAAAVLARARLLEMRGRLSAGLAVLHRAVARWPGERLLLSASRQCRSTP